MKTDIKIDITTDGKSFEESETEESLFCYLFNKKSYDFVIVEMKWSDILKAYKDVNGTDVTINIREDDYENGAYQLLFRSNNKQELVSKMRDRYKQLLNHKHELERLNRFFKEHPEYSI